MKKNSFYITTTLPYVNADPHIGFAMEIIHADIIARWKKSQGYDVFFNTGTDEHGQKIFQAAQKEGKDVKQYVDEFSNKFRLLKDQLGLDESVLHFIRTTDEKHLKATQALWLKCLKNDDIYKKKYKGLYCVGDEAFVRQSDLVDGRCPNHPNLNLEEIEEENYYFKLTKYKADLLEYIKKSIIPERRLAEAEDSLNHLDDISISREKSRLSWGIPVPNDDTQVMYVWFDALTNYISTLDWPDGENFKKFWEKGETVQFAGKDQVKFQSIIWQGMLKSAGLPFSKHIVYHGFVNTGGKKMSKSLGNVISPKEMIDRYKLEPFRVMMAGVNQFDDTDVNIGIKDEGFDLTYEANMVNGLGNLVARVMRMAETNLDAPISLNNLEDHYPKLSSYKEYMDRFEIQKAINYLWKEMKAIDVFIQEEAPFKQSDLQKKKELITWCVKRLGVVAELLQPFMPNTSKIILQAIRENKKPENLFPHLYA